MHHSMCSSTSNLVFMTLVLSLWAIPLVVPLIPTFIAINLLTCPRASLVVSSIVICRSPTVTDQMAHYVAPVAFGSTWTIMMIVAFRTQRLGPAIIFLLPVPCSVIFANPTLNIRCGSLIPSSSRIPTLPGYVANLPAIPALYSTLPIMVTFPLFLCSSNSVMPALADGDRGKQTPQSQMPLYSQLEGIGSFVGTVGGSTGAKCSSSSLSFSTSSSSLLSSNDSLSKLSHPSAGWSAGSSSGPLPNRTLGQPPRKDPQMEYSKIVPQSEQKYSVYSVMETWYGSGWSLGLRNGLGLGLSQRNKAWCCIYEVYEARGAKDTLGILFWGVMLKRFGVITSWDICYDLKYLLSNVEQFKPTNEVNTANVQVSTTNSPVSTADSPDSTTNLSDATVYAFLENQPNGSQLNHEDLKQIYEDDLEEMDLKWQLALLSMRARRYFQRTGKKITINGSDIAGYDKSKVECFNCHKMGHFARECRGPKNQDNRNRNQDSSRRTVNVEETSSKAMVAIDGADTSFKDLEINALKSEIEKLKKEKESNQIKIDKFENASKSLDKLIRSQIYDNSRKGVGSNKTKCLKGYGPYASKSVCIIPTNEVKKTLDAHWDPVKHAEMYRSQKPRGNQRNWNNLKSQQLGGDFVMYNKACFVCGSFDHVQAHCNYHQREGMSVHPQKEDQGYVDSGCSRHMTGNMSYLTDFKEFDGGYVTFGGGARGGRITGKGTLKTGS
ncbi:ribonuclease H-like domain-containing protein [Tanacetum coccineum]